MYERIRCAGCGRSRRRRVREGRADDAGSDGSLQGPFMGQQVLYICKGIISIRTHCTKRRKTQ